MTTKQPMTGPGRMQWNAGGWFGTTFGGTLWLLIASGMLIGRAPRIAAITLGCFVIMNLIAMTMWIRRDRIAPYIAFQVLAATLGVFAALAMTVVHTTGHLAALDPGIRPVAAYLVLLVIPAVMILAHVLERSSRARANG